MVKKGPFAVVKFGSTPALPSSYCEVCTVPDIQRVERLRDSAREEPSRYVSQLTGEGHEPNKATTKKK